MNEGILLSNTEISEDFVEDVLNVHPTEQPAEAVCGRPQILRHEFLTLVDHIYAASQQIRGLAQQCPMPLPADQAALLRAKVISRKSDQRRNQFLEPITPARRNLKIESPCLRLMRPQIDLGAHLSL